MPFQFAPGDRPLDGYTIRRALGVGGFGEVYHAVSDGGKDVALKVLLQRPELELRGIGDCLNLKHPGLVTIFDARVDARGNHWVVMEYINGPTLSDLIRRHPAGMPMDQSLTILGDLARALDYLHDQRIVHRDIKPANIFYENGMAKLGDYGLSKVIASTGASEHSREVGTAIYMAPEIARGIYGRSVDIYSLSCVAYEMVTGQRVFTGMNNYEVLMKHLSAEPDWNILHERVRDVFRKALTKDPDFRYPTAGEFVAALAQAWLGGVATPPPPVGGHHGGPYATPDPHPGPAGFMATSIAPEPGTVKAARRAVGDYLWSCFLAGVLSALIPLAIFAFAIIQEDSLPSLAGPLSISLLGGLTSWGLLALARWWDAWNIQGASRRLHALLWGTVMGLVAVTAHAWIRQDAASDPWSVLYTLMHTNAAGSARAVEALRPLLIYAAVFALAFLIPDWGSYTSAKRYWRFSLWGVVWPTAIAVLLANAIGYRAGIDPLWFGCLLGATSILVQWTSPNHLCEQRRHRHH